MIDITLTLHELGYPYKTNIECPVTNIFVDISLVEYNIAVLYVEESETVTLYEAGISMAHPSMTMRMKGDILKEAGWTVVFAPK